MTLANEAKKDVLGADVVVLEPASLFVSGIERAFGFGRESNTRIAAEFLEGGESLHSRADFERR